MRGIDQFLRDWEKVHNYLLNQTLHNGFRISRSTECLSENINDLEIVKDCACYICASLFYV